MPHRAGHDLFRMHADADRIASHARASGSGGGYGGDLGGGADSFQEAAAASLLTRGVPFALAHPAPRRWLPLKKSAWTAAMRGREANRQQLRRLVWAGGGGGAASLRCCSCRSSYLAAHHACLSGCMLPCTR